MYFQFSEYYEGKMKHKHTIPGCLVVLEVEEPVVGDAPECVAAPVSERG